MKKIQLNNDNYLLIDELAKTIIIYIGKVGSNSRNKIGVVDKSERTIYMSRNREKHLFRKFNAYGFNEFVLKNATTFDKIYLSDNYDTWLIPLTDMLEVEKKYMHFKQQGFELQVFILLSELDNYKI